MASQDLTKLDDEELLHLAIEATRGQRHGEAIQYLKEAAIKSGGNAKVHFLLGAEHAQIGLFDRAAEDLKTALGLDPSLVPARFQLGLLFLVQGNVTEALSAWKPLDSLEETNPYLHFKRGLERLAQDDFVQCDEFLRKGIGLNATNPPLNQDMQRILDEVSARTRAAAAGGTANAAGEQPAHVLLAAYTRTPN